MTLNFSRTPAQALALAAALIAALSVVGCSDSSSSSVDTPQTTSIAVRLIDENGVAISGAVVVAPTGPSASAVTNADGTAGGSITTSASKATFGTTTTPTADAPLDVTFTATATGYLRGSARAVLPTPSTAQLDIVLAAVPTDACATPSGALAVKFHNKSGVDPKLVSVGFVAGLPPPGKPATAFNVVNRQDGTALARLNTDKGPGNWYSLDKLPCGVALGSFSGRIYVAYGTPWTVESANYEPGQAVTDPNFFLRYDKMEITYTGDPADVANLTSIDYWSIPLTLNTLLKSKPAETVQGLLPGVTAQYVFDALQVLTPVSGLPSIGGVDGDAIPAVVPGKFAQYPGGPAPGTTFARIIGPSSYPPIGARPVPPYDIFKSYLTNLYTLFGSKTAVGAVVPTLGGGTIATIAGNFGGVGNPVPATGPQSRQTYSLAASIDANLDITVTGTVGSASGTTTMVYKFADLSNPTGIYGGNAPYYLNGASVSTNPGNDVYGWIGGDLFSGLNIGALGSTTKSGATMVGQLQSSDWFKVPTSLFFGKLQPTGKYYNQWAATLAGLSQAYNFAYSDRFAPVFVSLNPATVDTLVVTLEPATIDMSK